MSSESEEIKALRLELSKKQDKDLRAELTKRKIPGKFNLKKAEKIEIIVSYDKNSESYEKLGLSINSKANFTKDCRFRLLNMLFSENFCHDFALIGNLPCRADLDDSSSSSDESESSQNDCSDCIVDLCRKRISIALFKI